MTLIHLLFPDLLHDLAASSRSSTGAPPPLQGGPPLRLTISPALNFPLLLLLQLPSPFTAHKPQEPLLLHLLLLLVVLL